MNEPEEYEEKEDNEKEIFPDMTNIQNVTFGRKSGLLTISRRKEK